MSEFRAHSFDPVRERWAPTDVTGHNLEGAARSISLVAPTLVVAVKAHCDGCLAFALDDFAPLAGVVVLFVTAEVIDEPEWRDVAREVLVAPGAMDQLGINAAPYYALVDPQRSLIVQEGALFSVAQVASEIQAYLVS